MFGWWEGKVLLALYVRGFIWNAIHLSAVKRLWIFGVFRARKDPDSPHPKKGSPYISSQLPETKYEHEKLATVSFKCQSLPAWSLPGNIWQKPDAGLGRLLIQYTIKLQLTWGNSRTMEFSRQVMSRAGLPLLVFGITTPVFLGGPSKYWPSPTLLGFQTVTRSGCSCGPSGKKKKSASKYGDWWGHKSGP